MIPNIARYAVATIAENAALSDAVPVGAGSAVYGIVMPAAWTTAGLSFQGSVDGANFFEIFDNASAWTETAAASRIIMVDPTLSESLQQIKVRSGTSASPVNQGAERLITLIIRNDY